MQDISLIPKWQPTTILANLEKTPLDQKVMKAKLDKLYQISAYNQLQYVDEVLEAYAWIKLANEQPNFQRFFSCEKSQKWFNQEFIAISIRYMIICRRFKHVVMMALTQQMMIEALRYFSKKFDILDKCPKMTSIFNHSIEYDKPFFKLNYINESPLHFPCLSEEEGSKIDTFISTLKSGARVDVLKTDVHSKRYCWLPGTVKKITNLSIHVLPDGERTSCSYDKKLLFVFPFEAKKKQYQWRLALKQGDFVDLQDSKSCWVKAKVGERKQSQDSEDCAIQLLLEWEDLSDWYLLSDPRIQAPGIFTTNPEYNIVRNTAESFLDDFDDILLDPQMKSLGVIRSEYCRSNMLIALINFIHNDLNLFEKILEAVQTRKFGIEATANLVSCIVLLHPLLHRKFAVSFLPKLSDALISYIQKADEQTIRNFSKERFQIVNTSLTQFLKRYKNSSQRKFTCEELQLSLVNRFLQSDFLDRKLYAVSVLTNLLKQSKHRILKRSTEDLLQWVKVKGVMTAIYNQKSHSQLIGRSADFLQLYLLSQPSFDELTPLLEWNESILKLLNQCYDYLPQTFKEQLVTRIKLKSNVLNKDALDIVKRTQGCESWLLANGGQSWVSVVKEKVKRKNDIIQVFNCSFEVVDKITRQISQLYQCKFKSEFFLQLHEGNYLSKVLRQDSLPFLQRIQFGALAIQPLVQIKEDLFQALAPHTQRIDELPAQAQKFFINILPKIQNKNIVQMFKDNFTNKEDLQSLETGRLGFFKACFFRINEQQKFIDRKIISVYSSPHSYKKQKREILTIRVNPNQLIGMNELMTIVFGNKDIKVTQGGLQFIGFLFDHLAPELANSVIQFRGAFLQTCLTQLYSATSNQQKYLRIIEGLLDESQKLGIDSAPSVCALFLNQSLTIRVVDHFNVNKSRMLIQVPACFTLHQLRAHIARHLNAYPLQLKLLLGDKQLDSRLSGRIIHTLDLTKADLIAQKKITVEKISLCQSDGTLNQKCKNVLRGMFRQYSQCGLMSRPQCQKFHQRCVGGQVSSLSQNKVDKIYDQYDTDKDGYLTQQDFLSFYQYSAKVRQSAVWANLQTFGIRNDLEDLRQLDIEHPQPQSLIRHLLFGNKQFMELLIKLMQSDNERLSIASWRVASRLPLFPSQDFFAQKLDISKSLLFRYWLYEVIASQKWQILTVQTLQKMLSSDIETTCIGLLAALHSPLFEIDTFTRILSNLKKLNVQSQLSFHSQVVLDNSLKILEWLLKENIIIREHFAKQHTQYESILTTGLMSKNAATRKKYCQTVNNVIRQSAESHFEIFELFFKLVYENFEKCDKSTLSIEYFDLYSKLLEVLKVHPALLTKLGLNWLILTKSMISLFLAHKSTETGINSPPDCVAQGFLIILKKLLDSNTVQQHVPLVRFLFKNSLFPDSGENKLKNSKSRGDAYDLLYSICSVQDSEKNFPGLKELFAVGFKDVYKKMSANKATTYSYSSYFYSYNQARSQLGYAGIRNLGCICYMISMIQQLFMTQSFRSLILMADDQQPENLVKKAGKQIDDNLFHQLQIMFANLELTEKQDYTPDEFCFAFKDFDGVSMNVSVQQDAQQFLNIFFDKIETSLSNTPFKRILEDVFGGKTCNQTVCSNCKVVNDRFQNFYPLSLQIKGYKCIEDSFKKFIQGEVISDYQCDACKKKTDVTKSCLLAKVPNNFIIHLQRMCFNYDKFQNQKVNSRWEFPMNLNVYNYTLDKQKGEGNQQDYQFTLKGVVLHYGSAQFGHYFSYSKQTDTKWVQFNDERVRQFDPHDIEADCFGGEHWRRESQSAYLLVYEKVKKTPLRLQFDNQKQRQELIEKYKLRNSIVQKVIVEADASQNVQSIQEIQIQKIEKQIIADQQGGNKEDTSKETPVVKQKQKIIIQLNSSEIPTYVPEVMQSKISKTNEQFSFTLNLSNDEFAHFLHKILSINPPPELSTQFLQLCYECFHLRTLVNDQQNLTLSQWAAKRFKQIIGGHGWQFLKIFGQNWESDILSIEKSTRVGIKNLLQCVISDIIVSAQKEEDSTQKQVIIRKFLQKYTEMLSGEVGKNWTRFRQYFQVWSGLIQQSQAVRDWCKQIRMVERLLDFILQEYSPFSRGHKKYSLRNMHYGAQFEHPLDVLTLLLKEGYELSDPEKQCMKHYSFIEKVIKYPTSHYNLVDYLCRNDEPLSQKFAFILLTETSKVTQSDQVKPVIACILKFLQIKDDIEQKRVSWLIGFPQHCQNFRTNSYGAFGLNPDQQVILNYISPVRAQPILQQLVKFKNKAQHVACLLMTLILQLESDGYINNLDELPSLFAFTYSYTFWFKQFVNSYYEESHRSFMAKHYTEYGNRLKSFWENRPERIYQVYPQYLIGKTIDKQVVKQIQISEVLQVEYVDVVSSVLQITQENSFLNKKNIKNYPKSEDFRVKLTTSYGVNGFLSMDRSNHSSDDEEPLDKNVGNPFEKVEQKCLFRKIVIKNLSYDSILVVAKIKCASTTPNFEPSKVEVSFQIKEESSFVLTLKKLLIDEPFGNLSLEIKTLGKTVREGYWPKQIITEIPDDRNEEDRQNSDNDQEENTGTWIL